MSLADHGSPLAYDIAFWMQALDNPDYPVAQLGNLTTELSDKLRALAIITLLVKAETDFFLHNLIRSGRAREIYLVRARQAGLTEDYHYVLGRPLPLLDVVAAGDLERARRIGAASPTPFRQGREYEDDHWYAAVLLALLAEPADPAATARALGEWERSLEGLDLSRLHVVRAIADGKEDDFAPAFEALLDCRDAEIREEKERHKIENATTLASRDVFVEGLALLRLAERAGIPTAPEYRYCPGLARLPMQLPFPGE